MAGDMWNHAVITEKGLLLQSKVATGGTIKFTKVKTGAGKVNSATLQAQTTVTNAKQEFAFKADSTVNKETGLVTLVVVIDNDNLTTGYDCYQVGIYANDPNDGEILYAIMQSDSALAIPSEDNMTGWIAEMNIGMQFSNAETVQITMDQAGFASRKALDEHLANKNNPHGITAVQIGALPNTTKATDIGGASADHKHTASEVGARPSTWTPTASDIGLGNVNNTSDANKPVSNAQATAIADAKKAGTDAQVNLTAHITNKNNPHGVTAAQVGLGDVPNVSTNDQTPTYAATSSLLELRSGEKLTVAFGKIAKAITDLILHLESKNNPHGVTAAQIGAVPTSRTVNGKSLGSNITLTHNDVGAAPSYSYGTTDLTAGSSALPTGTVYLMYE